VSLGVRHCGCRARLAPGCRVDLFGRHRQCGEQAQLRRQRPSRSVSWRTAAGGPCWMHGGTVGDGRGGCGSGRITVGGGAARLPRLPRCLRPWGWARARSIYGLAGVLRPRRARCPACLITHVLLPVTVLVRREGPPPDRERAAGSGDTMRGWPRVLGGRLEPGWIWRCPKRSAARGVGPQSWSSLLGRQGRFSPGRHLRDPHHHPREDPGRGRGGDRLQEPRPR